VVLGDEEENLGEAGCPEGLAANALVDSDDDEWLWFLEASCLAFKGLSGSLLSGLDGITSLLCATLGIALMNIMGRS
jgi:hypothetical protein